MPGLAARVAENAVQRVWAFDEGRFRPRVGLRKRWCPRGVRPPWAVHDRYEWLWLYAAVEPATGQSGFLLLPRVTTEWFAQFLEAFGQETAAERVGLVWDGSGSRRADIPWPERVAPLPLPRYSPELNPAEQIFRGLRPKPANRIFTTVADLEEAIAAPSNLTGTSRPGSSARPATPGGPPLPLPCLMLRESVYLVTHRARSWDRSDELDTGREGCAVTRTGMPPGPPAAEEPLVGRGTPDSGPCGRRCQVRKLTSPDARS